MKTLKTKLAAGLAVWSMLAACQPNMSVKLTAPEELDKTGAPPATPELASAFRASLSTTLIEAAIDASKNDPWSIVRPDPTVNLPEVMERPSSWRRGVSLGLFASEKDPDKQIAIYETLLDEIARTGATDISIVVRWSQHSVTTTEISARPDVTVPDEVVGRVIDAARARGLRVFLLPIIYLEKRAMGKWRGTLAPTNLDAWWTSYEAFILHYARLAQAHEVSLYGVGSELLSMENKTDRWRALITKVRGVYKQQLTYSANWDHFEIPRFWKELDVVGMTAYQELTNTPNPDVAELRRGWRGFQARLHRWSIEHDIKYIFTEIGYPSHRKGAAQPWNYTARSLPAHQLQARCYRAMLAEWHDAPRLDGLYLWNWFGFSDPEDRSYTPRGKPAEKILSHWFRASTP